MILSHPQITFNLEKEKEKKKTGILFSINWASLVAQLVKNPPEMQETLILFLGQEDLLEKA